MARPWVGLKFHLIVLSFACFWNEWNQQALNTSKIPSTLQNSICMKQKYKTWLVLTLVNLLWSHWYLTSRVTHSLAILSYIICIHNFIFFFFREDPSNSICSVKTWIYPRELNILLQKIRLILIKQVGNHLRWCKNQTPTCSVEVWRSKSHSFYCFCENLICPCVYKLRREYFFLPISCSLRSCDQMLIFV